MTDVAANDIMNLYKIKILRYKVCGKILICGILPGPNYTEFYFYKNMLLYILTLSRGQSRRFSFLTDFQKEVDSRFGCIFFMYKDEIIRVD